MIDPYSDKILRSAYDHLAKEAAKRKDDEFTEDPDEPPRDYEV